ncbi:hypothetical protein ACFL0N_04430 [Pseudomonadota bacterium]
MKKLIRVIIWAIAAVFIYKASIWAFDEFRSSRRNSGQQEIADIDKECLMDADTGQCLCHHRGTGEFLRLPYDECKARAMGTY